MALVEDLYKKLSEGGYYTKSIEDLEVQLEDPMYRKKVHGVLTRDGLEDTDFETFDVKYTPLKKKEESVLPSMEGTTSGSLATPEMGMPEPLASSPLQRDVVTTTSQEPAMAQPDILKQFEEQTGKKISTTPIKQKEQPVVNQQPADMSGLAYFPEGTSITSNPAYISTDSKGEIVGSDIVKELLRTSSVLKEINKAPEFKYLMEDRGKVLQEVPVAPQREDLFALKNRNKKRRSFTDVLVDVAKYGKKAVTNIFEDIIVPSVIDERERQRRIEEKAQKVFDEKFRVLDLNNPEDRKEYESRKAQNDYLDIASREIDTAVDEGADSVVNVLKSLDAYDFGFEYETGAMGNVTVRLPNGTERVFDANGSEVEKNILKAFVTSVVENKDYYKTLNQLSKKSMLYDQVEYENLQKKLKEQEKELKNYVSLRPGEYAVAVFGKQLSQKGLENRKEYNRQTLMTDSILLENEVAKYKDAENALKQAYVDGKINYSTYNDMLNNDGYLYARENIIKQTKELQQLQDDIAEEDAYMQDVYTAAKIVQEERGNSSAYIGANFLKGFADIFGSMIYLHEAARGRGRYVEEISVSDMASDFGGLVTEEYTQREDMPDWEYALGSIANYAPGLLFDLMTTGGGGTAAKLTLRQVATNPTFAKGLKYIGQQALLDDPSDIATALMSFKQYEDQFNADPATRDMPEHEKILLGFLMSYTTAKLEKAGASTWLPKGLKGGIATSILNSAIKSAGKKASKEVIEAAIDRNISTMVAKGLINTTKAGVGEYLTEGIQTASEEGIKALYDTIKEADYFEDKTLWEVASDMNEAGRIGLVGGAIMGSITNSLNVAASARNNLQTRQIIKVLEDPDLKDIYKTYLTNQYKSGAMSKAEIAYLTAQLKITEDHFASIPDSIEDKTKAFELLTERNEISRSIAGKDEALIAGQKERIEQINNELEEISKNAVKKSTEQQQEGTADGGVVQREGTDQGQPQAGEGEGTFGQATQPETDLGDSTVEGGRVQAEEVISQKPVAEETVTEQPVAEEEVVIDKPTIATNSSQELERVKAVTPEAEDGATFNLDGTVYDGVGLVVPVVSINTTVEEATPEMIADFVEQHADKIGDNETVKVGIYKFPNSNEMSIDLNVVAPESSREQAIEFGRLADQESLFDLGSFQNVKTGGTGKNPMQFSGTQFKEIAKALKEGRLPNVFEQTAPSQSSTGTVISGTDVEIDSRAKKISKPRMTKIVARAAKAVARILPNTKFIVHDTQDSFAAATGETDSGGYFNPATGEIHINLEKANARTVAHEVFHAVLLNAVKTDANAAATTRKMIEAISKKIDNDPKLKKYLDKFLSQYEENIQNEEKAAELAGVLAEKMSTFSGSIKDVIKRWLDRIAKAFGLNPFNTNEVYDVLTTIARKTAKGIEITNADVKIIEDINNGTLFENEYVHTNGTVVSTPSGRKSKFKNTVVKESDIISTKEVEGKPLEVVYYDNFTSSPYQLKNRKSGSVIERQGEGGPGYSYREEIKAAGIVAAFTNVTKGLNLIQGVRSRNNIAQEPAVVGVALQNKETGHLGNLTTARDFYSPTEGVIAQAINDGLITEADAVTMLKGAVKAYESTKKGQSKESSLGFKIEDFNTLEEFYNRINDISFERRGTFNDNVIPLKADLKITKATRPYVSTWIDAGIPTLNEYYEATTEQYTKEAQAHDIVKYLDPNLDKIGISSDIPVSDAEVKRAADMGVGIVQVDDSLTHTSYPVVLFGNNIGIPSTFNSVREMAEDWNVPNPFFKAGRRKDTAEPVRVPELKETGRQPAPRKQKALQKEVADKLTEDGKGNYIFHHYSNQKRETIKPRSGDNMITGRDEAAALSSVGGVAQFYTQEGQKEAGVGPVLHTVVVPKDKVYYLQEDQENFYDEARRQFLEVRPGQAFSPNYQAAWISKVAADNGYDMLVSKWKGDQLRAQTVKELTPIEENIPFKEQEADVYKVGDEVIVYGGKATITAMDGTVAKFKGERMSGSIDTKRNATSITKVRKQKANLKETEVRKMLKKSDKYIEDRVKKTKFRDVVRSFIRKMSDRQGDIKRSINGIDSIYSRRAFDLLINKAGAAGYANEIFKEADKRIYKGLNSDDLDTLNDIIYCRRMIAINENRANLRKKAYSGLSKELSKELDNIIKIKSAENVDAIVDVEEFTEAEKTTRTKELNKVKKRVGEDVYKDLIKRSEMYKEPYTGLDGFSEETARKSLQDIKDALKEKKYWDLQERADEYFKVFEENLKRALDSGRITQEAYNALKDIEYSPIRTLKYIIGEKELTTEELDKWAKIYGVPSDEIKKLGTNNNNEIISNTRWLLMMNINSSVRKSFENKLLNAVSDAFENANDFEKQALSEIIVENPVVGQREDGSLVYKYDGYIKKNLPRGYKEVTFFKDGVRKSIIMKELYADQLLDVFSKNEYVSLTGKLLGADLLRFFATGGNPIFILGNIAADFSNILFFSDVYGKIKPIGAIHLAFDFVKNFLRSTTGIKFKEIKKEYLEHGGGMDYMSADGIRNAKSRINRFKPLGIRQKAMVTVTKTLSFLGEKSEEAFRISVYEKTKNDLIKKWQKDNNTTSNPTGQDLEDIMNSAVREARQVIDFNQGGTWAKNIDSVLPYFNVAFQSAKRAREYYQKNPIMFGWSMLQAGGMAAGLMAGSLALLINGICDDDESTESCNEKIKRALDSVSSYEKANYHIIFTGNTDENGEFEYIRIKKLPLLSIVTTLGDQLMAEYFLGMRGMDYDSNIFSMNTKKSPIMQTLKNSFPIDFTDLKGIIARNPAYSAYMAGWENYDTFKGEEIFKKPLKYKYDEINPEVEGLSDDNVNNLFKAIAPTFGLSPIRTQAFFEKIFTSETTNPLISLLYAVGNGMFVKDSEYRDSFNDAVDNLVKNTSRKLIRTTNKNIATYTEEDKTADVVRDMNSETLKNEQALFKEVEDLYKDGKRLNNEELNSIVLKYFDGPKAKKYRSKVVAKIKRRDLDRGLLDIAYEDDPELQAYYIYEKYGKTFDEEETIELNELLRSTGKKLSRETKYYYNKNYKLK